MPETEGRTRHSARWSTFPQAQIRGCTHSPTASNSLRSAYVRATSKVLQTLPASLRFLCQAFSPSCTPCERCQAREGKAEGGVARLALSLTWAEPAGVCCCRGPLPTSATRGQQSVALQPDLGRVCAGENQLGGAGRPPGCFFIKLFLGPRL